MTSDELTAEQTSVISKALFPGHNYIARLIKRMEKAGFPHDDPLYIKVEKVRDAMHELTVAVHYMACDNVGRGGLSARHLPMNADNRQQFEFGWGHVSDQRFFAV